ncbi:hypothetical protein CDL15_Pgr003329 [Punica granatum]|uniref:Nucleobase-ascorbate transporter 4 n=1 Tax=Punica granatum TaxID=22663 RepID=A0A218X2W5_PUNGR|nr:hypothetical protein CDL15_Pgr003329 [Punica granatum]PKI71387.1 hypothetical protein CRG98_008246 [Punica granatum]
MAAPKADDFQPHPVKDQLPGVDFCLTSSPPWPEAIIMGFQHYLVMLGTTVLIPTLLVPLMGGGNVEKAEMINTLLFVSGISTLYQCWFGSRLPVVIGPSYTYIIPAISIALSKRYDIYIYPHERFEHTLRGMQGALLTASLFQVIFGFLGFCRIFARFLCPLSAVPFVTLVGLGLYANGFPQLARCIEIGLPELILLVIISQHVPHFMKSRRAIFERYAVLVSVMIVWAFAAVLTVSGAYDRRSPNTQFSCRVDRTGLLRAAPWIKFPYPFQYGGPTFNAGDAFAVMAAALVALIESMATFIAASRFASATPVPPSVLSRGVGWLGLSTFIGSFFGTGVGYTALVENAGLLGLTRIGSRRVVEISACFMLFFSVLGKFGAILASIPLPIFAAVYCVLYAYVAAAGLGLLQFCNLNSFRTKFILGFSLFMGLSVPQYFNQYFFYSGYGPVHTRSIAFNSIVQVIFTSAATVALIVALFLERTHSIGHGPVRRDSGRHWWAKFYTFEADVRSEEFYSLPYNLNRFFPSF